MSEQNKKSFREQLLSQEKTDTQLQKNFQMEVKKMYTEKLKMGQRIAYILLAFVISFITLCFWISSKSFEKMQTQHQVGYLEGLRLVSAWATYLGVVLTVLSFWPAIRGKLDLRFYPKVVRFIFWLLILAIHIIVFTMFNFMFKEAPAEISNNVIWGTTWLMTMMILIIMLCVHMLLSNKIDRGDFKNETKRLELEYRLAELEEKLNRNTESK